MVTKKSRGSLRADLNSARAELKTDIGAVKADLNDVKADLGTMKADLDATRTELKAELDATRTELKTDISAVRTELRESVARLSLNIVNNQVEIREIKSAMATKDDIKRILDSIDDFSGKAVIYGRAAVLHGQAITELQVALKDHDRRLTTLETRPA